MFTKVLYPDTLRAIKLVARYIAVVTVEYSKIEELKTIFVTYTLCSLRNENLFQ